MSAAPAATARRVRLRAQAVQALTTSARALRGAGGGTAAQSAAVPGVGSIGGASSMQASAFAAGDSTGSSTFAGRVAAAKQRFASFLRGKPDSQRRQGQGLAGMNGQPPESINHLRAHGFSSNQPDTGLGTSVPNRQSKAVSNVHHQRRDARGDGKHKNGRRMIGGGDHGGPGAGTQVWGLLQRGVMGAGSTTLKAASLLLAAPV